MSKRKTIDVQLFGGPHDGGIATVERGCTAFAVAEFRYGQTHFGAYELDKKDGKFKFVLVKLDDEAIRQTESLRPDGKPWPKDPLSEDDSSGSPDSRRR